MENVSYNLNLNLNFCGLPKEFRNYEKSKIVILPVPYDKTSTWLKGSDKAPKAIIEASQNLEFYDIETDSEIHEKGIYTHPEIIADSEKILFQKVYKKVTSLLKEKKFVVTLGGEHSISLGAIKAHIDFFREKKENVSILQLDAHLDMRNEYNENKFSHASVMARVKEWTNDITQVGIRSMDFSEKENLNRGKIFYAHKIQTLEDENWIEKVINSLNEKNVYATIDLDVFDPGIMSTGTPEPGGLNWYQVNDLINELAKEKKIVGFDVVELCPSEHNKAPDFLVAKLIYRFLSQVFYKL